MLWVLNKHEMFFFYQETLWANIFYFLYLMLDTSACQKGPELIFMDGGQQYNSVIEIDFHLILGRQRYSTVTWLFALTYKRNFINRMWNHIWYFEGKYERYLVCQNSCCRVSCVHSCCIYFSSSWNRKAVLSSYN